MAKKRPVTPISVELSTLDTVSGSKAVYPLFCRCGTSLITHLSGGQRKDLRFHIHDLQK